MEFIRRKISIFFLLQNIRSVSKNFEELSQLVNKIDPLVVALTDMDYQIHQCKIVPNRKLYGRYFMQ